MENKTIHRRGVLVPGLKPLRESMGLTRAQVASRCSLDVSTIFRIEEQHFGAGYQTLKALISGLETTEEALTCPNL